MGLEDKFYPDDGTLINKIDNTIIRGYSRLVNASEEHLGIGKDGLRNTAYGLASLGFFGGGTFSSIIPLNIVGYLGGLVFMINSAINHSPMGNSPLETEIKSELRGENRKTHKYMNFLFTVLGSYHIIKNTVSLTTSNYENLNEDIAILSMGLGLFFMGAGSYINQTKIDPPNKHKKTVFNKIKDKVYSLFPKPVTE